MAKLQPHAVKLITEIVERYKDEPTPTMMILEDIQKEYGYIPLEVQELVSELTGVPVSDIDGSQIAHPEQPAHIGDFRRVERDDVGKRSC